MTLTVGAAVDVDAQSDTALAAPLERDEAQETRHDGMLQLVPHHALGVGVAQERLQRRHAALLSVLQYFKQ